MLELQEKIYRKNQVSINTQVLSDGNEHLVVLSIALGETAYAFGHKASEISWKLNYFVKNWLSQADIDEMTFEFLPKNLCTELLLILSFNSQEHIWEKVESLVELLFGWLSFEQIAQLMGIEDESKVLNSN